MCRVCQWPTPRAPVLIPHRVTYRVESFVKLAVASSDCTQFNGGRKPAATFNSHRLVQGDEPCRFQTSPTFKCTQFNGAPSMRIRTVWVEFCRAPCPVGWSSSILHLFANMFLLSILANVYFLVFYFQNLFSNWLYQNKKRQCQKLISSPCENNTQAYFLENCSLF